MSYYPQYGHDQHGIPDYNPHQPSRQQRMMPSSGQGRRAPPIGHAGPDRGMRFPVRPQQSYAPPAHHSDSTENLYDGSAYGEPEAEQWPLTARPVVQQQQAPRGMKPQPSGRGPPPQRPQRPDAPQQIRDPPRQAPSARVAPVANKQYHPPPPPPIPQHPHHGSGEWTGDGYSVACVPSYPQQGLSHQAQHAAQQREQAAQLLSANRRPPLGPPPSARRGPASYYPQVAPVHPIVEETDSVRGSIRNARNGRNGSMGSFASSNAIPIGVPDYYLENRDSAPSMRTPDYRDSAPSMKSGMTMPDYYLENRDSVPSMPERRSEGRSLSEYESDTPNYDGDEPLPLPMEPLRMGERDNGPSNRDEMEREEASPEPAGLVRQASLGKRSKPTLTTVKSGDRLRKESAGEGLASLPSHQRQVLAGAPDEKKPAASQVPDYSHHAQGPHLTDTANRLDPNVVPAPPYTQQSKSKDALSTRTPSSDILSSGTGLIDPSSSESEKSIKKARSKELLGASLPKAQRERTRSRSPLAPSDPRVEVLKGLEKGGALSSSDAERQLKVPAGGMSGLRAGKRRPPRLNVDAVKEAEARGSLTSLPDLIKRATKLASNLDRGRTASRLGMTDWLAGTGDDPEKRGSGMSGADYRRSAGSLSDILASFPPPGLATPPGSRGEMRRSLTNWSSNLRHSMALPSDSDGASQARKRQKKRCCGMPLWLFLLLLVLLLLLVAAAIIVPVVLIVVPRQNHGGSSGSGNAALDTCQKQLTCQNGGVTVVGSDGGCKCICVNNYTGRTCLTPAQGSCTSTAVGSTRDATVGNDIPRLLDGAALNYSIPLDGETLLGLFSSSDLTCQTENELVTFNNVKARGLPLLEVRHSTPTLQIRQATTTGQGSVATSNGIVFESGSPTGGSGASAGSSAATSSSTAGSDSSTAVDFAKVAVLYIFQSSGELDSATTAQTNLQSYFASGETSTGQTIYPANVSLGNGFSCDLNGHSVSLANGTTVGGNSNSS